MELTLMLVSVTITALVGLIAYYGANSDLAITVQTAIWLNLKNNDSTARLNVYLNELFLLKKRTERPCRRAGSVF